MTHVLLSSVLVRITNIFRVRLNHAAQLCVESVRASGICRFPMVNGIVHDYCVPLQQLQVTPTIQLPHMQYKGTGSPLCISYT
jgi:hypothetical protein